MNRFFDGFANLLLVVWIGSLMALGAISAPVLFSALGDKQLAGMLAGKMFAVGAWVGISAGIYLLVHRLFRDGKAVFRSAFFWLVLVIFLGS